MCTPGWHSGVTSVVADWRGKYSYIRVHKPQRQSISKEVNDAKHDIFAPLIINAG